MANQSNHPANIKHPTQEQQDKATSPKLLLRELKFQRELLLKRKRSIDLWQAVSIGMFTIALILFLALAGIVSADTAQAQVSIIQVPTTPEGTTTIMCFPTADGGKVCY